MPAPRIPEPLSVPELRELERELAGRLDRPFDSERFCSAFRSSATPYNVAPPEALAALADQPPAAHACCVKLALVRLLIRFDVEGALARYPACIREQYVLHQGLAGKDLRRRRDSFYALDRDIVLKDLALFNERMLPGGAQLFEARRGVPRRIFAAGGAVQAVRAAAFFFPWAGALAPFFEMHTDPRRMDEFTAEGWRRFYCRVARMLAQRPEIRGIFSGAWWNDPSVGGVSPHLAHLYEVPVAHGAGVFHYRRDEDARNNALVYSAERQAAFESGRYDPASYILVWLRDDLIAWSRGPVCSGEE